MKYCTLNDDDGQSNVQVTQTATGIEIQVAKYRTVCKTPPPPPIGDWWTKGQAGIDLFAERERALRQRAAQCTSEEIQLPHAGECLQLETASQAFDFLVSLQNLGYHIPERALKELRIDAQVN